MCYKKNKSLFLTSCKMPKFHLQKLVVLNMIKDFFLIKKWGTLEAARRYNYKNLLNSGSVYSKP